MTKKVFIGVLAALMLFGFTACEQKVPEIPHDVTVIGARITAGDLSYYLNEEFESERYTVEILFSDGEPREINGAGILSATPSSTEAAVDVSINYAGYTDKIGKVYYYGADFISVNTANAKTEYVNPITTSTKVDTTGLVVTATYNGNKTTEVTGYTAAFTTVGETSATVTVSLGDKTATYDVKLVEDTTPATPTKLSDNSTVERIEVEFVANEGSLEFYRTASNIATTVKNENSWKVTGYDKNGNYYVYSKPTVTGVALMQNVGTYKVQVSVEGKDKVKLSEVVEVTVKDAPTYKGLLNGTVYLIPAGDYELSATDKANIAKMVYGVMADYSVTQDFALETISQDFFPADQTSDQTVTISVSWTKDPSVVLSVTDSITIRREN